ncbi:MAG: PAS domain S-box protein, partial [Chloroflexota bacterium]
MANHLRGTDDMDGLSVAVQGVGQTGADMIGQLVEQGVKQAVVVTDVLNDPHFKKYRDRNQSFVELGIKSVMLIPIIVQGKLLGSLGADAVDDIHEFTEREVNFVKAVADRLGVAIENQHLFNQTQIALGQTETLYQVGQIISHLTNIEDTFHKIAPILIDQLGYHSSWLALVNEETATLEGIAGAGKDVTEDIIKQQVPLLSQEKNPSIIAVLNGTPLLINDILTDERASDLPAYIRSILGQTIQVPIFIEEKVVGLIAVSRPISTVPLTDQDLEIMIAVADQVSIGLQNSTNLEQLENALQDANIFRQFVEAAGQGIGFATLDGHAQYLNPAFMKLLDEENGESALGKPIISYYPEEMHDRIYNQALPTVMETGQWRGETTLISKKGKRTEVIDSYFLLRDDEGHPLYLADISTDITDRKAAEEAVKEREEQFSNTIGNLPVAVAISLVSDGTLLYINDAFTQFFGSTYDELINLKAPSFYYNPDDRQLVMVELKQHGIVKDLEIQFQQPRGTPVWGAISIYPIRFFGQDAILSSFYDLTERRQAELERQQLTAEIQRLATIVENHTDFIGVGSLEGAAQYVNPAGLKMMGLPTDYDITT